MRQPIQVSVFPVRSIDSGWDYLMLRRVPRPTAGLAAFWQGITGGVEEGEDLLEAAMRELAEETGIVPSALEQIGFSYSFPMEEAWRGLYAAGVEEIEEHVFVALVGRGQEPRLSWEHDRYEWCGLEQALALLTYPGNVEALRRCDEYLSRRLLE
jgi:dATP pyrophosphohydrolase